MPRGCLLPSYQLLTDLTTLTFSIISEDYLVKQMGVPPTQMTNTVPVNGETFLAQAGHENNMFL